MDEQQRHNYLMWMKERGQSYLVPRAALAATDARRPAEAFTESHVSFAAMEAAALPSEAVTPTPPSRPPASKPHEDTRPLASPLERTSPAIVAPVSPPAPPLKVIFYSHTALSAAELEMVTRIAGALSLKPSDFQIVAAPEAAALIAVQPQCAIVVMGDEARADLSVTKEHLVLGISHPGAMLREPQLKVAAWNTLHRLKAAP